VFQCYLTKKILDQRKTKRRTMTRCDQLLCSDAVNVAVIAEFVAVCVAACVAVSDDAVQSRSL